MSLLTNPITPGTGTIGSGTYGMQILGAAGQVQYNSTDVTWNQVEMFQVAGYGSASKDYPVLQGREVLVSQVMINPPPINRRAIAHTITVSGSVVNIYGGSEDTYVMVMMR